MIRPAVRNRLIIGVVVLLVGGFVGYQMFFSLTPPRHADHDHAMAKLDAGGFLWIESLDGKRRNLVGRPGRVVVLHFFDPAATDSREQRAAARFAAAGGSEAELLLIAVSPGEVDLATWLETTGVPRASLYVDSEGKTAELIGVRRLPETLIYDPAGLLAHQARGPMRWSDPGLAARLASYARGVEEIG